MDDAVRVRDAARAALADVEPERLHDVLAERVGDTEMTPAVCVLRVADALGGSGPVDADAPEETRTDAVAERAAGVQLIYEGLRLTRTLAHEEPWAGGLDADGDPLDETNLDGIRADLDILAADVLVARGFYLLARTEAADRAVAVVRAFGRDQTVRRRPDADRATLDGNLEADVFGLAADAGATAAERETTVALVEYANGLAREYGAAFPPVAEAFPAEFDARVATLAGEDRLPSSAADS